MTSETEWLVERWQTMTLIRRAEERIAEMVEAGEVRCPCHLYIGQEAVAAGVCAALTPTDTLWGGHRSHGHYLAKGGSLAGLFGEVLLKAAGCAGGRGGSMHLAAPEVGILGTAPIVAGTVPLAAGAAFAYKLRGEDTVAVAFFGDGALEEGHVHESMNLAALYRLPLVLICENNLYASHLHWSERRVADNLHRAGEFHSVPGEQVDGNDVVAVHASARTAVERARSGDGPTFIECRTFRWRGHVGASFDLDVGVERRGELAEWLPRDPLRRLADQLIERGVVELAQREQAIDARIASAVEEARAAPQSAAAQEEAFMRTLTYAQAIREAHAQMLQLDARVFVIGQGLWSPWYAGASLEGLDREFGYARVVDTPVSENAVTGMAVGAALAGLRPIVFHPRMDFMLLAMDPIVNQAANWSYLFGDHNGVPLVIRAVINRGGEQGAQHSQALHAMFMHVPGLKVVMPSTPADAKGLLMAALADPGPVLYIDDRWLYAESGEVAAEPFTVAIGEAAMRRGGSDVTLIGISWMAHECVRAAGILERDGIDAEVIDLRSLKPWDKEMVTASVSRTGRAVVADGGWRTAGASADIAAEIAERVFDRLLAPVRRVTLPDAPAPASRAEEQGYYPGAEQIAATARALIERGAEGRVKRAAA